MKQLLLTIIMIASCLAGQAQELTPKDSLRAVRKAERIMQKQRRDSIRAAEEAAQLELERQARREKNARSIILKTEFSDLDEAFNTAVGNLVRQEIFPATINETAHYLTTDIICCDNPSRTNIVLNIVAYLEEDTVYLSVSGKFKSPFNVDLGSVETAGSMETILNKGMSGSVYKDTYLEMKEVALSLVPYAEVGYKK